MHRFWRFGLGVALAGGLVSCGSEKDADEDSSLRPTHSDSGTSPSGDSGDSADTSGPETGGGPGTELNVRMNADVVEEGGILSVHWLDFEAWSSGGVVVGSTTVEALVNSESMTIIMPEPREDELRRPSEDAGHSIAVYALAVRTEDNLGEVWRGVSENWLLWSTEDVPDNGVARGWNFFSPETQEFSAAEIVQLPSNLNPIDVLSFSGRFEGDRATGLRSILIPLNENPTAQEKVPIVDKVLGEEWSFELDGRPPENHFYFSDEFDVDCAGELPAAYMDVDGDDVFSPEKDTVVYNTCLNEDKVVAYYWEVIRDLERAIQWVVAGWKPGWVLARKDSSEGFLLSEQELSELNIGRDCLPENTEPS